MHVAALFGGPLIAQGKIGPLFRCRYRLAWQRQPERIRADMNAPHSLRMSHAQPGRYPRADITAAGKKSLVSQRRHHARPQVGDSSAGISFEGSCWRREPESWQRRDNEVASIFGAPTEPFRLSHQLDQRNDLQEATGPAMRYDHGHRLRMRTSDM